MKILLPFIVITGLLSCNDQADYLAKPAPRTMHIPDSTKGYAKNFDYKYYLRKKAIIKQLNSIRPLENDSSRADIRLWVMSSSSNPQKIYLLKKRDSTWNVSRLNYYINFKNPDKVDSIEMEIVRQKILSPEIVQALNIDKIWNLPSQGEMKNGNSYGCNDGNVVAIEMSDKKRYKFSAYNCPDFNKLKDTSFQLVDSFLYKVGMLNDKGTLSE